MLKKELLILIILLIGCQSVVDRTYYTYLGLQISASNQQIKQAYLKKKQKIQTMDDNEQKQKKLKILQEAYYILGNQEKRVIYDRLNKDLMKKQKVVANLKKLTDKFSRKGRTIQISLPVSVEDVYHGKVVEASFQKQTACKKCHGTGAESPKSLNVCSKCGGNGFSIVEGMNYFGQKFVNENTCQACQGWGKQISKPCPVCGGKKIVTKMQKVKITIPKGLPDGNVLKVSNFGDEPINGAPADFEVTIVEIPSERWSREGENLINTVDISFKEAIFGFSKTITHLSGQQMEIKRSEVTTRETRINIPGKGIENIKTGKHGGLSIRFRIVMPKFSVIQMDMWEQFFRRYKL